MPRKLRTILQEVTYHTTSRCIETRPLMNSDNMKQMMIEVLNLALEKYNFELINYAIMDNHFHFYIRTVKKGENISRIMQFIKSQYARRYNRIMERTGPFWNERFSDTIIMEDEDSKSDFFYILNYISYNPVKSGQVKRPSDYKFSGARCFYDEHYRPPVKITFHTFFLKLGKTFQERFQKFKEYEEIYRMHLFSQTETLSA